MARLGNLRCPDHRSTGAKGGPHGAAAVELTAAIKPTEGRRADRLADPTGQPVGFRIAVASEPGVAHTKMRMSCPQLEDRSPAAGRARRSETDASDPAGQPVGFQIAAGVTLGSEVTVGAGDPLGAAV